MAAGLHNRAQTFRFCSAYYLKCSKTFRRALSSSTRIYASTLIMKVFWVLLLECDYNCSLGHRRCKCDYNETINSCEQEVGCVDYTDPAHKDTDCGYCANFLETCNKNGVSNYKKKMCTDRWSLLWSASKQCRLSNCKQYCE